MKDYEWKASAHLTGLRVPIDLYLSPGKCLILQAGCRRRWKSSSRCFAGRAIYELTSNESWSPIHCIKSLNRVVIYNSTGKSSLAVIKTRFVLLPSTISCRAPTPARSTNQHVLWKPLSYGLRHGQAQIVPTLLACISPH